MRKIRINNNTGTSVKSLITQAYDVTRENPPTNREWASQFVGCVRKATLRSKFPTQDIGSIEREMYFKEGEAIEDVVIEGLRRKGVLRFAQYKLPQMKDDEWINLGGKIDAVIERDGVLQVLEIKSAGAPLDIRFNQWKQAQIYHVITGMPTFLVSVDRNVRKHGVEGLNMKETPVNMTPEQKLNLLVDLFTSDLMINAGLIAEVDHSIYGTHACDYCAFKTVCNTPIGVEVPQSIKDEALRKAESFVLETNRRKNGITKHINRISSRRSKRTDGVR